MSLTEFTDNINWQRFYGKHYPVQTPWQVSRQLESDRGRIIHSAAIRRLQQKTQVFPLERNAAVRSRLTHSLEVQQVGRHITKEIFHTLELRGIDQPSALQAWLNPCESLVEMACLLHDIGNPPFGHFGESAINGWFAAHLSLTSLPSAMPGADHCQVACLRTDPQQSAEINALRQKIRQDLSHFEGNAQAFRLVHSLLKLNLTYVQMACIIKYTRPAYWLADIPSSLRYLMKKPGYYLSEEAAVEQLYQQLQLTAHHRFALTYIMEAADDIAYCIADLEDAVEKKIISIDQLQQKLAYHWQQASQSNPQVAASPLFTEVVGSAFHAYQQQTYRYRSAEDQFFMRLRVNMIGKLVPFAAGRFVDNLTDVLAGSFNQALLEDNSPACQLLKIFKDVAINDVFCHEEVEQLELQGYRVINGLLDIYQPLLAMPMAAFAQLVEQNHHKQYPIESRLYHKLSRKHCLAYCEAMANLTQVTEVEYEIWEYYYRARLLQDYISGMTDLYAYDEYRRLTATL